MVLKCFRGSDLFRSGVFGRGEGSFIFFKIAYRTNKILKVCRAFIAVNKVFINNSGFSLGFLKLE